MKKLFTAVTLMLVFSITANAQAKKADTKDVKETTQKFTPEVAAKKNADELSQFLSLKENETDNFERLFKMKQDILQDSNMSEERKTEMKRVVEAKIRATLDGEQMEKLESNPELFKRLLN